MSLGKLVGSIDEGTTSARFMIFRAGTNNVVCYHQIPVQSIYPQVWNKIFMNLFINYHQLL